MSRGSIFAILRRASKLFFGILLIGGPSLQIVRTFWQEPYPYMAAPLQHWTSIQGFLVNNSTQAIEVIDPISVDISGGPYSFRAWSIHFAEPLTSFVYLIESALSKAEWNWIMLVSFLLPLIVALVMGRVYCGYVCPVSSIVNLNIWLRKKFLGYQSAGTGSYRNAPCNLHLGYMVALGILILMNPLILQFLLPASMLQHGVSDYLLWGGLSIWMIAFLSFLLLEFIKPALFCKKLCPTGLFLSFVGARRKLSLNYVKKSRCEDKCISCNVTCWLDLEPKKYAEDPACDLCGRCVQVCPTNRLTASFAPTKKSRPTKDRMGLVRVTLLLIGANLPGIQKAEANIWSLDQEYQIDIIAHHVLYEGKVSSTRPSTNENIDIFFSFVGGIEDIRQGGTIGLYLHLKDSELEIYNKSLLIEHGISGKRLVKRTIEKPNFPVSILKRSSYQMQIPFEKGVKYWMKISSPEGDFENIEIQFTYPPARI